MLNASLPGFPLLTNMNSTPQIIPAVLLFAEVRYIAKLTPKQERFCEEYLVDLNAAQSYLRAGYKSNNPNVARIEAHKLLTKPNIQAKIAQLQKARSSRTNAAADDVINELKTIAFAETDITEKGKMKALELLGKHLGIWDKASGEAVSSELPCLYKALTEVDDNDVQ